MDNTAKAVLGYVLKGYPRISETFISNEILRLEEQGFRIVIFSMRHPREKFSHDSVKRIRAEVHYLPTYLLKDLHRLLPSNLALAVRHPKRYGKALAIAIRRYFRTKKTATFKHFLQAGFLVNNHIESGGGMRPAHLHGHFAHSPTSVTMFASLLTGIPYSFTAHAKDIYTSSPEQLREKIANSAFVATCTRYNSDYLRTIAGSAAPIHCIYHGIDTELFFSPGAREHCTPPYALLTVARLTEKKGLPTLFRALARLKAQGVRFHHTLIGDGDDRELILAHIRDLDLTEHCSWLGTLSHEEVLQHFRQSDLFLLSCQVAANGDRDGVPNVLVESLAMGVPAISTEVSAIPELIRDEQTGLLVPPEDSEAMASAIIRLLTDTDLRRNCIAQGQALVRQDFDNKALTAKLADVFLRHLNDTNPSNS